MKCPNAKDCPVQNGDYISLPIHPDLYSVYKNYEDISLIDVSVYFNTNIITDISLIYLNDVHSILFFHLKQQVNF